MAGHGAHLTDAVPASTGRLRVLMISGSYPPMRCGVGDYTRCLAEALAQRDEIVFKLLTSVSPPAREGDPSWLQRALRNWRIGSLGPYLRELKGFRPDIVHAQYPTQGYSVVSGPTLLPFLARMRGRPAIVQTWHEYPEPLYTKFGLSKLALAATADAVIYVRPDYPKHIAGVLSLALGGASRHFIPNASVLPTVVLGADERASLKAELGCGERQLLAFFGFAYPHKGVEQLFEIADPARHHLVLIGELSKDDPYHAGLLRLAGQQPWRGKVSLSGFSDAGRAARILAAADAAIFPFVCGGGPWNSSVHAAISQGTFTILASREHSGYVPQENIYFAPPGAIEEMRSPQRIGLGSRHATSRFIALSAKLRAARPSDDTVHLHPDI
jgi:glycosyltransferase involved in cell wall biosynthesis